VALRLGITLVAAALVAVVLLTLSHADNPTGDLPWQWTVGRYVSVLLAVVLLGLLAAAAARVRRRLRRSR